MARTDGEVRRAMEAGYNKAMEDCKFGPELYVAGFVDGMLFLKDGTIPESRMEKMLREYEQMNKE